MEIPPYFDYRKLDFIASSREKNIKTDKFFDLKNRVYGNLINYSLNPESEKGINKKYRERVNKLLEGKAISLLRNKEFCNDLLKIAKDFELLNTAYSMDQFDFLEHRTSPSINAFMARLRHHTIIRRLGKIDKTPIDLETLFENAISLFLKKYNLEFFWTESIIHLLITGVWYLPRYTIVVRIDLFSEKNNLFTPKIYLELSSNSKLEEIKLRWNEIEDIKSEFFSTLKKRNKPSKYDMDSLYELGNELSGNEKKALGRLNKNVNKLDSKIKIPSYTHQMIFDLRRPIKSIYFF